MRMLRVERERTKRPPSVAGSARPAESRTQASEEAASEREHREARGRERHAPVCRHLDFLPFDLSVPSSNPAHRSKDSPRLVTGPRVQQPRLVRRRAVRQVRQQPRQGRVGRMWLGGGGGGEGVRGGERGKEVSGEGRRRGARARALAGWGSHRDKGARQRPGSSEMKLREGLTRRTRDEAPLVRETTPRHVLACHSLPCNLSIAERGRRLRLGVSYRVGGGCTRGREGGKRRGAAAPTA